MSEKKRSIFCVATGQYCCTMDSISPAFIDNPLTRRGAAVALGLSWRLPMRWLFAAAALSLALPVLAQDNEAEKLYRGFEKKVREAKVYQTTFDIKTEVREQMTLKGDL